MISTKLRGLLNGVAQLDTSSIVELTTEFGKNVGTLASAFSGGLPEVYVAALDKSQESVSLIPGVWNLPQTLIALGDLAVCIANQIFHLNGTEGPLLHDNGKS